jgi:hypothetical protein
MQEDTESEDPSIDAVHRTLTVSRPSGRGRQAGLLPLFSLVYGRVYYRLIIRYNHLQLQDSFG